MTRALLLCCFLSLVSAAPAPDVVQPHWTRPQAARLVEWLDAAADDALEPVTAQARVVQAALDTNDQAALDAAATEAATRLLEAHRHGCCGAALRSGWHIADTSDRTDAATRVGQAVAADRIDALFASARPSHPYYLALRAAYHAESDPARRATLAANLDRWRWMPRALGTRYLLVNTAAFEATLWEDGKMTGRWRVVAGKTASPTPVFAATVTGVILNPWWEIPPSIAREGIAALLRTHPAQAAAQGYVLQAGRYRQRPGANNALGRMKLVMPNGYSVYLHDTPEQKLFAEDVRAYSHGCVRVGDALGLVAALLSKQPGWTRGDVDAAVATGRTRTVALAAPVPIYIAYFTAEPDDKGDIRYIADIYHRDTGAKLRGDQGQCAR
ncbi:L,D-transpeptidase family protein [Sphingomonas sp. H39-1-10]|uniref:L,D-transpeptidase family protein n=1 Tax=Sphingomonas pollutisoli TaxID=3030829 RepID=UPI0023B9BA77|nr:L,D-transpeptidase family protein [Sphingomonas pollutisoli]MDF0487552.1 L,D-transpeptidase family protein [Sphingomonas pollutisoli]